MTENDTNDPENSPTPQQQATYLLRKYKLVEGLVNLQDAPEESLAESTVQKQNLSELQAFLDNQTVSTSSIVFAYDKGMSFGKYIQYQFFVKHLVAPKGITINSNKEYVY